MLNGMAEEDSFEDATLTPLSAIAEAFEELAESVKQSSQHLRLDTFCDACSLITVLLGCLGIAFKFAELDYVSKVRDLLEASKTYETLQHILDADVANYTVRESGSHSRNLRRVRQGLDLIRAIFEQFLLSEDDSLREAASTAYTQVFAPYHTWAVRTAVAAGMYALPTREQLLAKLSETNESAEKQMRRYISASGPVIEYIDQLYTSKDISLDW